MPPTARKLERGWRLDANGVDTMRKPLTSMATREILDQGIWCTNTVGSCVCGPYQVRNGTLRDLAAGLNLKAEERFTPGCQNASAPVPLP